MRYSTAFEVIKAKTKYIFNWKFPFIHKIYWIKEIKLNSISIIR